MYDKRALNRPILKFNIILSLLARCQAPIPYLCFWPWGALQIFQKIAVAKLANKCLVAYQGPLILK